MEEYCETAAPDWEAGDWQAKAGSGLAWPVGEVLGGAPGYAPLAWGSCKDEGYSSVAEWVTVTDLDGAGGEHVPGRLLAAYWQGRVWLRIVAEGEEEEDSKGKEEEDGEGGQEVPSGAGYVGTAGGGGLVVDAPGRAVLPQLVICPMESREMCLKTADGRWRADVWWEVVANWCYHLGPEVWTENMDEEGNVEDGWQHAQARRVTVWAVACGNVLCFYTTASDALELHGGGYAAGASRLEYSAWGVPYKVGEMSLQWLAEVGGPFFPWWAALLPWEADGTEPATEADGGGLQEAMGPLGTQGLVGDGYGTAAMAPPVMVCGRLHWAGVWGIAYDAVCWPWEFGYRDDVQPTVMEHTGYVTWQAAVEGYLLDEADVGTNGRQLSCRDFCFDPVCVEGYGVSAGGGSVWVAGREAWPPVVADYELLCSAELQSPAGRLWVAIAGAATGDGVLLTASNHAEVPPYISGGAEGNPEGTDMPTWEDEEGEVPGPETPEDVPDEPAAPGGGAEDGGDEGEGGGGGGSPYLPPSDPEDGGDDGGGGDGDEWLEPDGVYLLSGHHTVVRAQRQVTKDAEGVVTHIGYEFAIDVTADDELVYTAQGSWRVRVRLSTSNGGEYDYKGGTYTMYHGFGAAEYESATATATWKSSYLYSDSDPKETVVHCRVGAEVTAVADFPQSGYASAEGLPKSNILAFRDAGRTTMKTAGGKKRRFRYYRVDLLVGVLGGIAKRMALAKEPVATVTPAGVSSARGTMTVGGAHDGSTPAHADDYGSFPVEVTGCLLPAISAEYVGTYKGQVGVSGSAHWHFGGSADGTVEAKETDDSFEGANMDVTIERQVMRVM